MKKVTKLLLTGLLLIGLAFTLLGCGSSDALIVGTNAAYPPFEMQENGEITGFDIELIKAIAEETGLNIEVKHMDFDGLIPAIKTGSIDIAISAMTIRDDRIKEVNFSNTYYTVKGQAVVVQKGKEVKKLEELANKFIGVEKGTTGMFKAEEIEGMDKNKIKAFKTTPDALMDLQNGSIAAVIADAPVVERWLKSNPNSGLVVLKDIPFEEEDYGIAMKKGNDELTAKINEGLEKVKASGKYDELLEKYELPKQ